MDSAASTLPGPQSEPAAPPRWVEDAREVLALVRGLITEHRELRNAVDALQRERDDLREALERQRQEHERQVWLHTSVQEQTGALLAEIRQLVADAKQKRRVAQDTGPFARGLQTLP